MGKHLMLRKIKNTLNRQQFIGIKRSEGKILAIDLEGYGNVFVRQGKILAINFDDGESR